MKTEQKLVVLSKDNCPYCTKAIELLKAKGIPHTVEKISREELAQALSGSVDVSNSVALLARVMDETGHRSFPMILAIKGEEYELIGGSDALSKLMEENPAYFDKFKKA